jgi:four helix bundle protein
METLQTVEWTARADSATRRTDMQTIRSFRDLDAWHAAMDLALAAHKLAANLPPNQKFELASQIRRSATSIPSNIAEGHAYRSDRVFLRHVRIALGSLAELETQIEVAVRLKYVAQNGDWPLRSDIDRTGQLLNGLRRTLWASLGRAALNAIAVVTLGGGLLWMFIPS